MRDVYPHFIYRDPSECCDTLRRAEDRIDRMTDNCPECRHYLGEAFGRVVCDIGRGPDSDGYCRNWVEKT